MDETSTITTSHQGSDIPEISRFMGIVIRMYYEDHSPPHIHVFYSGERAVFRIEDFGLVAGKLPPRVVGLVAEWMAARRDELLGNWRRAERAEPLVQISPLE